jgi:hypothetical protein
MLCALSPGLAEQVRAIGLADAPNIMYASARVLAFLKQCPTTASDAIGHVILGSAAWVGLGSLGTFLGKGWDRSLVALSTGDTKRLTRSAGGVYRLGNRLL